MLLFGLAQLAGALAVLLQPSLPPDGVFLFFLPFALVALRERRFRWFAGFWLGASLAAWQAAAQLADRLPYALDGETVTITGRIEGLVETDIRRQRFLFRIESGELDGEALELPSLVRLSLYEADFRVASGERWRWQVKLRRPRGLANPGGFDYERWLFVQGIGVTGYVREPQRAVRLDEGGFGFRAAIARRIEAMVDGPAAGMLRALATGDRGGMEQHHWEVLRLTGTTHLMSISGLHVAMVTGLAMAMASFLRRSLAPRSAPWWPALITGLVAVLYAALAGFSLPVRRALYAAAIVLFAMAARRQLAVGQVFGCALVLLITIEPLGVLDISFWLSYGAVGAILYLVAGRRPAGPRLLQATRLQLGLFLLTAPMIAASFAQLPLVSPLANAIAIPVFGVALVPGTLLATVLVPVAEPLARLLFRLLQAIFEPLLRLLEWLAAINPEIVIAELPPLAAFSVALGVLLACAPRALPGRRLALALLLPLLAFHREPVEAPFEVHVLDVGQGLAVVVETRAHVLVYDTGPAFTDNSAAEMAVIPFLRSRGRHPDRIMISHGDNDHAGGLAVLRRQYPRALVSGRTRDGGIPDCRGESWSWDGVWFEVVHASGKGSGNAASCVLRISDGRRTALLTGDIDARVEAEMLASMAPRLAADVVIIPHHGSLTSSSPAFIRATGANIAFAGTGHGNRWNFPRREVVQRWREAGAQVFASGEHGAVSVALGEALEVRAFRERRRLWREPVVSGADGK